MPLFRKKPVVIEATQWFKHGDHPQVTEIPEVIRSTATARQYEMTDANGWVGTLEGGHVVAPGDWIIKGVQGELYPCKPDIFAQTYDAV